MKKSYLIMAAIASVALVSCSNEEYLGDPGGLTGERAISFDMSTPAMTRAETTGEAAAEKLRYSFQVYATKTVGTTTSNVFAHNAYSSTGTDNTPYWAWYEENTAGKTNSNLNNWEYVGGAGNHGKTGYQVTLNNAQTIKYWDKSATNYTFVAVKANGGTISNLTTNGFTVTGTPTQLANLYVANKEIINKTDDAADKNKYGSPVKFTFRNFTSKIRFGIYENIPGYSVKINNVYYSKEGLTDGCSSSNFGINGTFSGSSTEYIYNVTYDANNIAQGTLSSGTAQGYFETESSPILSAASIGTSATTATYDKTVGEDTKAYTVIMPNPDNNTGMTLKIDITLTSEGESGETIELKNASATVPANFCQWQSNYAYTYLFKISDLTQFNGELLCPITLDAVVTDDGQGNQNTITIVETPSITTYQNGDIVDDYTIAGGDIFVTVEDADGTLKTLTTTANLATSTLETVGNASLFTITSDNQTSFTEAEIEKALKVRTSALTATTVEGRNGIILTPANPGLTLTNTIETASGDKTVYTPTNNEDPIKKAAKFTPDANKTYAFVYTVTGSSNTNPTDMETKYEAVPNLTVGESSVKDYYCEYQYNLASGDAQSGVTYYAHNTETDTYTAYADGQLFCGDDATGLYTLDGTTYKPASGKIATGITYYPAPVPAATAPTSGFENYLVQSGDNFIQATGTETGTPTYYEKPTAAVSTIAYDSFGTSYYKLVGTTPTPVADGEYPVAGTNYYSDAECNTRVYIQPQQLPASTYTRDATPGAKHACPAGEKAIAGEKYYDRYEMYEGNYAVKVIKVQ